MPSYTCVAVAIPASRALPTQDRSVPKLTDNRIGPAASASSSSPASLRITQSTRPIPKRPLTCCSWIFSAALLPSLPMPTMPRPPAALTAAASRPPATPPIGALTIGARRPKSLDQGVDSATSERRRAAI